MLVLCPTQATQRREEAAARRREALAAQQTESRERRLADVRRAAMETLLAEEGQDEGEVEVEDDEDDEDADMAPSSNKISGKKMRRPPRPGRRRVEEGEGRAIRIRPLTVPSSLGNRPHFGPISA